MDVLALKINNLFVSFRLQESYCQISWLFFHYFKCRIKFSNPPTSFYLITTHSHTHTYIPIRTKPYVHDHTYTHLHVHTRAYTTTRTHLTHTSILTHPYVHTRIYTHTTIQGHIVPSGHSGQWDLGPHELA